MEMERVPQAGYQIIGLPVRGFDRSRPWKNIRVVIDLIRSMRQARQIVRDFRPDAGVGVGGYASGAAMKVAAKMGVPILLQEQNGFAGVTNKLLKDDAQKICVAYEGMERFFPADRIILSGNPIRKDIVPATEQMKEDGYSFYGLNPQAKHIFVVGGSLGSRTLNEAMKKWISEGCPGGSDIEVIWQCGKYYKASIDQFMQQMKEAGRDVSRIQHSDFIQRMDLAYAVADVVISRSGASSVSFKSDITNVSL
jgi:UDP-N-acetylglucosamine--N-acetylmuramyl-(pentapeptide) pyrophosphoryl-undecaprenol N-acetylglucosamine transferase